MDKAITFAVDRLEGDFAVLEADDGSLHNVPLTDLPHGMREGSVLCKESDGVYSLDAKEEARRRAANFALQESLFNNA